MEDADKLPLLKAGMKMLVDQLRPEDKVTIVAYAGAAGVVLEPTAGQGARKRSAPPSTSSQAGGSTAGGEGIQLAYAMAQEAQIDGGINRIILATDGDFNVGVTDTRRAEDDDRGEPQVRHRAQHARLRRGQLQRRADGADRRCRQRQLRLCRLAERGEAPAGRSARRATIQTIAKDVKVQVEFNPAIVAEYRLIGYENRALKREDFNNDQKDAGEIGAGHTVTALYEIALEGLEGPQRRSPALSGRRHAAQRQHRPDRKGRGVRLPAPALQGAGRRCLEADRDAAAQRLVDAAKQGAGPR